MKKISFKIITALFSFFIVAVPIFVFAQIDNPLKAGSTIPGFIATILGYIVKIGGVAAIFAFIWAGFSFVKAQGNPTELEKAKTIFINTCIGVAVLLGAQLISTIIVNTLNSLK
jgi:hypothetical protein